MLIRELPDADKCTRLRPLDLPISAPTTKKLYKPKRKAGEISGGGAHESWG